MIAILFVPILTSIGAVLLGKKAVETATAATIGPTGFEAADQEAGMIAINKYMQEKKPRTKEAIKLRDEWIRWYSALDWWDISFDDATYNEARNRKSKYDLADATTAEEKATVEEQLKRDPTRLSTGFLPEDEVSWVPSWVKPAAYGTGAGVLGVLAVALFRRRP